MQNQQNSPYFYLHSTNSPHPHHPKVNCYFLGGGFGDGGGNWYICGDFFIPNRSLGLMGDLGLLVNVIFFDDEKDFDWAAFGGGVCEFGLG